MGRRNAGSAFAFPTTTYSVRDGTVQVRAVVKPRFLEGLHPQGFPAIRSLVEVLVLVGEDEGFGI